MGVHSHKEIGVPICLDKKSLVMDGWKLDVGRVVRCGQVRSRPPPRAGREATGKAGQGEGLSYGGRRCVPVLVTALIPNGRVMPVWRGRSWKLRLKSGSGGSVGHAR